MQLCSHLELRKASVNYLSMTITFIMVNRGGSLVRIANLVVVKSYFHKAMHILTE